MTLSLSRHRCLSFLIVPFLLVALSSCGSGSGEVADSNLAGNTVDADADGNGQEGTVDQEATDQESTEPEVPESEDNDPEVTEPDGSEQGSTDGSAIINQPNILLVITDDQGIDASAQYSLSNDLPNTPVINALARNGITYENVWGTPSCSTTRAALLTGMHGVNTGVLSVPGNLSADFTTIQRFLSQNEASSNYQTAVFGKWHVDGGGGNLNHPNDLGVGHYAGHLRPNITDYFDWTITINGVEERSTTYHTTALVDNAIDWIDEQQNPWFAWLAFAAPHAPYHAPPDEFNTRGLSGTQADINANEREYFLSSIETLDAELGRLLDSMDPATRDNTIVMVIGDNGTPRDVLDNDSFLAGHQKGSLFEGGVRVPLVISGAGVTRTNVRENGLVSVVDFFPTIAALTTGLIMK